MRRGAAPRALLIAVLASTTPALAQPARTVDTRAQADKLRHEPRFTFCKKPKRPLFERQHELCSLAAGLEDCEGLKAACGDPAAADRVKEKESSTGAFGLFLAALAKVLVWVLVVAVVLAIAFPLLRALLRARRDKQIADAAPEPNQAVAVARKPAPEPSRI